MRRVVGLVVLLLIVGGCGGGSRGGKSGVWIDVTPPNEAFSIDELVVDPQNPKTVYDVNGDISKSVDAGASWQVLHRGEDAIHAIALDPRRSATVYAGSDGGVFKSTNGGASLRRAGLDGQFITTLAVAPGGRVVYAGDTPGDDDPGVYKSLDAGASWQPVGLNGEKVTALTLDPRNPNTVYADTYEGATFKSTDGGARWRNMVGAQYLAADPNDAQVIYSGSSFGGGVWRSRNGGATWRRAGLKGESVTAFAFGPKPNTVYAATLLDGVFKSRDAGATWRSLGPKGKDLWALAVGRSGRLLYAGDSDGRLYQLRLSG